MSSKNSHVAQAAAITRVLVGLGFEKCGKKAQVGVVARYDWMDNCVVVTNNTYNHTNGECTVAEELAALGYDVKQLNSREFGEYRVTWTAVYGKVAA